jgi:hypothetical protein
MSRASTQHTAAVDVMRQAVVRQVFTQEEVENMFMEVLGRLTVTEMENLLVEETNFDDLGDVEFML